MCTIYALVDPRDGTIRYIGCTTNLQNRYRSHLNSMWPETIKTRWVKELRTLNLVPELLEIERAERAEIALQRKQHWINFFLSEEEPLLNSALVTNKMPSRKAGRQRTDLEVNAMIEEYHRTGKRPSDWTRQALSAILKKRGYR